MGTFGWWVQWGGVGCGHVCKTQRTQWWRARHGGPLPSRCQTPTPWPDATLPPAQGRAQRRKGRNASGGVLSFDARAGYLPWPELQPGDPDR